MQLKRRDYLEIKSWTLADPSVLRETEMNALRRRHGTSIQGSRNDDYQIICAKKKKKTKSSTANRYYHVKGFPFAQFESTSTHDRVSVLSNFNTIKLQHLLLLHLLIFVFDLIFYFIFINSIIDSVPCLSYIKRLVLKGKKKRIKKKGE